jgi:hypothetical protein
MKGLDNSLMMEEIGKGRLLIYPVYSCSDYRLPKQRPASFAIEINPVDTYGCITKQSLYVIEVIVYEY